MSSSLVPKALVVGLSVWIVWRLFGPVSVSDSALIIAAVLCFGVPLVGALVLPYLNFELGQRIMRLYRLRKDWLVMRDLPVASKRAWRRVRAEARRRQGAALLPEHAGQAQRDGDGQGPFAADQIRHRGHENQ